MNENKVWIHVLKLFNEGKPDELKDFVEAREDDRVYPSTFFLPDYIWWQTWWLRNDQLNEFLKEKVQWDRSENEDDLKLEYDMVKRALTEGRDDILVYYGEDYCNGWMLTKAREELGV